MALNEKLVFVVDDEAVLADAIASFLQSHGYNVIAFSNPTEALAAATSLKPDLLLSDFKMEKMDGLTLAMGLTEQHPECKVLLMSGFVHDATTHPAFEKFEFLRKPVPLSVLLARVVEALGV